MALDDSKKKLRKIFHRSRSHRSNIAANSTSRTPNKSSNNAGRGNSRPIHDNPSRNYQNTRGNPHPAFSINTQELTFDAEDTTADSTRPTAVEHNSNDTPSPQDLDASVNDGYPDQATAPGLHNPGYQLPKVPRERDFSSSFDGLTLASRSEGKHSVDGFLPTQLDEGRNSENIADRNLAATTGTAPTLRLVSSIEQEKSEPKSQPLIPHVDQHASNVADWNIVRNDDAAIEMRNEAPHPLKVKKRTSNLHGAESSQRNTLEPDSAQMRDASWSVTPLGLEGDEDESPLAARGKISNLNSDIPVAVNSSSLPTRASLDKPLPLTPPAMVSQRNASSNTPDNAPNHDDELLRHSKQDSAGPFNLDGVDVQKQPDTVSLHERRAPAVTHETIKEEEHVTRQEVITRETHDYHIYHRILPIIDIEVKPARHFVPVDDGFVEIAEEELPGRTREKVNWAIAEMVSQRTPPKQKLLSSPRRFTARTFEGPEFDDREYIGAEGHPVKEKWWVHPPTLCQDAYRAGQTYPFHFGSENPEDDGLKAKLPAGNVIGVSRRLMERRQKEAKEVSATHEGSEQALPAYG